MMTISDKNDERRDDRSKTVKSRKATRVLEISYYNDKNYPSDDLLLIVLLLSRVIFFNTINAFSHDDVGRC